MTGRVADEDAVPHAVVIAFVMFAMNLEKKKTLKIKRFFDEKDNWFAPEGQLPGHDGEHDWEDDESVKEESAQHGDEVHAKLTGHLKRDTYSILVYL